ncbi:MAG: hypothetical protein LUF30_11160 [Lachnospiraceae bacterium]|nr:hypothetical protein [Lachnospiraceae bacterium]
MNNYLTGIAGMPKLLDCCGDSDVMELFQKKTYSDAFKRIYQEHVATFDAIENGYNTVIDKEQFLTNMADALTAHASELLDACQKKSKKEKLQMDLNLTMAVFVLPMVLEFHGNSSEPLSDKLTESWKRQFPKTNKQAAPYVTIEEGFKKKCCYITTAVCRTFGKPDDCYELTILRNFRDTVLAVSPEGEKVIDEYYDVAPSIVKHIDQQPDSGAIYQNIWEKWLSPCISMIEAGQMSEGQMHYTNMVHTLKKRYFHSDIRHRDI